MFDGEKKVPFECYAKFRIRGAALDSLRNLDELGRADGESVVAAGSSTLSSPLESCVDAAPTRMDG
jgi:hypothetical protein